MLWYACPYLVVIHAEVRTYLFVIHAVVFTVLVVIHAAVCMYVFGSDSGCGMSVRTWP